MISVGRQTQTGLLRHVLQSNVIRYEQRILLLQYPINQHVVSGANPTVPYFGGFLWYSPVLMKISV